MTTRFSKRYKNANNLFNSSLLRGGRVSPETLLDTYQYSESRKLAEMKDMYQNIVSVGNDVDNRGNTRTGSILISEMTLAGS
jgi:hypothetical protein